VETITIDYETFYSKDYSLSKMQTDAYILGDQFQTIMVGVELPCRRQVIVAATTEIEVAAKLHNLVDWSQYAVRCHNTLFDGFIATQVHGIKPKLWKDTLGQARMLMPWLKSHSLAKVAEYMGLGQKGTEVHNMLGKRLEDMSTMELKDYSEYCTNDVVLTRQIGERLDEYTPALHFRLIDMTIRMFTEPKLVGDLDMMQKLYDDEVARKKGVIALAGVDKSELMSNPKFAERLKQLGVTPPMKVSARTGKLTFAFAKTDKGMTDLLDHHNPKVAALVAARTGIKSTIAETRALRYVEMTKRGPLPVFLNFWGAKTTGRYSGGNKVNWQNIPARGPSAGLRMALCAPEGYSVVVGDSSNIELRTVMALAGQEDALVKIRNGVDMYCDFASQIFGKEITKKDKAERFLGKTAMLGLQYGAGAARFQEMIRQAANSIAGIEEITLSRAQEIVDLWRRVHHKVVDLWRRCDRVLLNDIANGCEMLAVDVNGWFITQNEGFGRPGEPGVVYKNLRKGDDGWVYDMAGKEANIYGAKMVENLCQHAAMLIVMWQTARINQRYQVCLSVHDEAVTIARDDEVEEAKAYMTECLDLTPKWCRGFIPVACEVEVGKSYGDAK
jgi:DNA polymerase I-like protein with 3'-5' exonuclease and polymerase domains